jgi:hypothetical protein
LSLTLATALRGTCVPECFAYNIANGVMQIRVNQHRVDTFGPKNGVGERQNACGRIIQQLAISLPIKIES